MPKNFGEAFEIAGKKRLRIYAYEEAVKKSDKKRPST